MIRDFEKDELHAAVMRGICVNTQGMYKYHLNYHIKYLNNITCHSQNT